MKTAVVEREHLGGICLNWGCIPTKALLRSSELFHLLCRIEEFGISLSGIKFDLAKMVTPPQACILAVAQGEPRPIRPFPGSLIKRCGRLPGSRWLRTKVDGR